MPGDRVLVGSGIDGYRCVTFRSTDGRQTSGFLSSAALVDQSTASPALADWAGRWVRDDETSITIKVKGAALSLSGQATWGAHDPERVKRGGVNAGEIDTVATPRGSLIAIGSGYDGASPRTLRRWTIVGPACGCSAPISPSRTIPVVAG